MSDSTEPSMTEEDGDSTFPVGAASRLTGLTPELMRAWESRYQAIQPTRTAGGTRRYTRANIARLRLLRAAVDAGHRIGRIAGLDDAGLAEVARGSQARPDTRFDEVLIAIQSHDALETRRLLAAEIDATSITEFAEGFALPLAREIGRRWSEGTLPISAEHLATGILRSILANGLGSNESTLSGPPIVFATPSGEPHDLGLLIAAHIAERAGARAIFVGADTPCENILDCARSTRARAVAVGLVTLEPDAARRSLTTLEEGLDESTALWVGGPNAQALSTDSRCEPITDLRILEEKVMQMKHGVMPAEATEASPERGGQS